MALPKPAPSPGHHPARLPGAERPVATPRASVAVPRIPAGHAMQFQPMVHVDDMPAAVAFYERLGAELVHGSGADDWVLLQLGTTQIGLLAHPPRTEDGECTVELNFAAAMPLDDLERRLRGAGVTIAGFETHPDFGDQLRVRSPDGLLIKINQLEPDIEK
jgi:catechol 2,3-dioxygenase-like lactoylglutathione lyase family enzyme